MNKFHDALKSFYGPKGSEATALFSADGNTRLTDIDAIFERWTKHFNSVLKGSLSINNDAIDRPSGKHVRDMNTPSNPTFI